MNDKKPFQPFVPENHKMPEFTFRAVLLGLVMTVILGAANAYLGLRAGHDDRGHLPGGGDRHGRAAALERLRARGEYRPNRRVHRRIGGGRRDLHDPGVRHLEGVAAVRFVRSLLEIDRA